jgi:hypothetical protein
VPFAKCAKLVNEGPAAALPVGHVSAQICSSYRQSGSDRLADVSNSVDSERVTQVVYCLSIVKNLLLKLGLPQSIRSILRMLSTLASGSYSG